MRIVSWNCAQKLDAKYEALLALKPDIAIIPECAEPDIVMKKAPGFRYSDCEWQGDLKDKGLGVFAFNGHSLRRHQSWDRDFHIFLPIEVRGPTTNEPIGALGVQSPGAEEGSEEPRNYG